MKSIRTLLLLVVATVVSGTIAAADAKRPAESIPVPGSWIVELEAEPTLQFRGRDSLQLQGAGNAPAKGLAATAPEVTGARRFDTNAPEVRTYAAWLDRQREDILDEARVYLGRPLEPSKVYRHVFNGFSAQMSNEEAAELAKVPGVRSVRQDMAHKLELDEGPSLIGAPIVWSGMGENSTFGEGVVIGIIDSGINWDHRYFSDDPSDTGGHAFENPLGEQLGECSKASVPCNNKLIGVWDFTTEGTNGRDPDDNGHGTHVASTAAGNRWSFGLQDVDHQFNTSGVAPRANIVSYKVCYTEHPDDEELDGRCVGSAIAEALEQSVKDGVDVVNYSIGGTPDQPDPWQQAQAFLNVRNAGIVFVTSAGNAGPEPGTMSSPANAPWTFSIGSTSHRRRLGNSADVAGLTNLFAQQGSGPELESDITAPVIAADSVGDDLQGCESFPSGAFDGAIAFMRRGDCLFETKVNHAHEAGAVAVLIFNNVENAFAISMGQLEDTEIPSAMLDNEAGLAALDAIRSSSSPFATLYAAQQALLNSDWQDRMSDFSSRGPGPGAPGVMKPNVTAPGQSIIGGYVPDENSIGILSGTSMASPHAAGAAALIKSAFPDWTPTMIQSALETTAQADPVTDRGQAATMLDRGAGRLRVDRAARAGLFLPIEGSDFNDANPAFGGDPEALNLAGIHSVSCADLCTFTRTVRAINSGSWTVSTTGDALEISVTPESFSLDRGQEQELTIEVGAGQIDSGEFGDGAVVLSPNDSSMVTQRLPVGVLTVFAEVPEGFELVVQRNRGRSEVTIDTVGEMIEPAFRTSALVKPRRESFTLAQDPSPSDPYSGGAGRRTFLLDVPEETLMLFAETVASEAPDIDLFVGFDQNGDGVAQASEEVCRSISPDELEQCLVKLPESGQWWVLVQNWEASSETANDNVELDLAVLTHADDPSLVVTGPGRHPGGALELPVSWDQPAMRRGERWLGALGLSNIPDELANIDVVPITFKRIFEQPVLPTALYAGEERSVVIAPQGEHDRLYFDVPPSASSVNIHVVGSAGVSAELRRMDFDEVVDHSPGTPPADGELMATGSGSSTGFEMTADARAGRWYVVLDSIISSEALVDVSVEITESDPVRSQRGLWSPRDRLINQGIEWQRAGPGFMTWYSYDVDGLPVFYQAAGEVQDDSSIWQALLYRITNSTGQRQNPDVVGEVSLTMLDDNEMVFAWRLDGFHGSDIMAPDAAQTCPEVNGEEQSYSGHWFSPDELVGGTTMIVTDSVQAHIRYYFDNLGIGRWLLASDPEQDPLNEVLELIDFRGFCPGCEEVEIETESVGVYTRVFESESAGAETVEFVSAEPLNHEISIDVPVVKLSEPLNCQ